MTMLPVWTGYNRMSIQITPIPRLTQLTAPAFTLGTSNAAGAAITAVASNSTLLAFDAVDPESVAAAAAVGSATVSARRDHVHSGVTVAAATQAQMEAASVTTAYATPGRTQYHPGVAKVWCAFEESGAHSILASYNMTSVTDGGGPGDSDVLWATDFSSANWAFSGSGENDCTVHFDPGSNAVGGCTTASVSPAGNRTDYSDPGPTFTVFGDQ